MEEANVREPISYDRFPVRPGDEPDELPEQPSSSASHLPSVTLGATRHATSYRPPPSSFTSIAIAADSSIANTRPSFTIYEEPGSPPPPFANRPPGLGRPSEDEHFPLTLHDDNHVNLPSRPPTASAPPAYSPSDPGHSTALPVNPPTADTTTPSS